MKFEKPHYLLIFMTNFNCCNKKENVVKCNLSFNLMVTYELFQKTGRIRPDKNN